MSPHGVTPPPLPPADPGGSEARIGFIQQLWRDRLRGVQRHVEVWQSLFSIRSLVVPMAQDVDNWLKFASLCRKSGRSRQAYRMLLQVGGHAAGGEAGRGASGVCVCVWGGGGVVNTSPR